MTSKKKLDRFYAKIAFFLSLGFWVPLFNIGLCIVSLIFALKALKLRFKEPETYGGLGYAIAALILSLSGLLLTAIGTLIYLLSNNICGSTMCQVYFETIS